MPSILVVEQEDRYVERIRAALTAEGWKVRVVPAADQAIQAAASEAPDLVMISAAVPAAATLAGAFSRSGGGPGAVGLLSEGTAFPPPGFAPDDLLAKPFTDEALRDAAKRALDSRRPAAPAESPASSQPPKSTRADHKLTSQDIFGDVLDEVEGPRSPAPPAPTGPPPLLTAAATAAARPAPPTAPAPDDEMKRRLEKTLSGMLAPERLAPGSAADKSRPTSPAPPVAAAPPPRRSEAENVDAMLSRTLSNLDLGKTKTGVRPPVPPTSQPAAPPAAALPVPPPRPPAPAAAAPSAPVTDSTAVRKARAVGEFDFSELEELARPGRAASPPAPARPPAAPVSPEPPISSAPPAARPPAAAMRPPAAPPPFQPPAAAAPSSSPLPPLPPRPAEPAFSLAPDSAATQRIPVFTDEPVEGERFGQYTLLERIAAGGMAEVWKARMRGVEGFQKTVAIKRILPHMTDNAEFVGMFIDEAKLAAQLSHPNIVHIYDLGKIGRDYYIAMEYVEGKDLRSLLNAGRHKGLHLPLSLCLLIASRLASALDYAHRKRDFEDRELGLVHRDVSPQNVLLTYDGDVKLCDFGIAKAVSKASQTLMGALKGKLQYMSPEQAWGRPVDARSDLFSLGSVLFEMITGERLFAGDSEISVLEAVRQGRVRSPRQVNPAVPKEVDDIVGRALAVAPQARFQSAGEMKQRLEAALASLGSSASSADLSAFIHRALDPGEPGVVGAAAAAAFPAPAPLPVAWPPEPASAAATATPIIPGPIAAAEMPPEVEAPIPPVAAVGVLAMGEEGGRKSRTLLYVAIAALVVVAIATFWFLNRRRSGTPLAAPGAGAAAQTPGQAPGATPGAASPVGTPQSASATPAPTATPGVNVQELVDKQLAKKAKEEDERKKLELQNLEKQLAAAKAAGKPATQNAGSPPVPTPAIRPPAPEPVAPPTQPAPEPQREPEAAKTPEKPPQPTPEQAKPRAPEPAPAPRVKMGDLVEPGPGVSPPQLVNFSKPAYPPLARTMRVEGDVVVSVLVDENGQVQDARVTEPIRQKVGINEAALSAARSAHYKPATKEGVRVRMWTRLRIPFKL